MSAPLRAATKAIARFDTAIDTRVDRLRGHPHLDRLMYTASELGDFSLIWHLTSTTRALGPDRRVAHAVRVAAVLGAESLLVNGPVKSLFRRHRPAWEQDRPRRLRRPRTSSFPSGHASAAMTAAGLLGQNDPLWPLYYALGRGGGLQPGVREDPPPVRRGGGGRRRHRPGPVARRLWPFPWPTPPADAASGSTPAPSGRTGMPGRAGVPPGVTDFAVTWDYRCPFARNAHEHVIEGLRGGADWNVRFVPFSLGQVHVAEGEPDVWVRPESDSGLLALQVGVVVRDRYPDRFLDVHEALFALRHDAGRHLEDEAELRAVLTEQGVDADAVFDEIATGAALETVRDEHTAAADDNDVWGVPTFVQGDRAVFVRLMERPRGDTAVATRTIDRVVGLLGDFPELNEFKHTSLKR